MEGSGRNGVLLVGTALDERGLLADRAGFLFGNLLQRAGLERNDFWLANAMACKPPDYRVQGQDYEYRAVAHCKRNHLLPLIDTLKPKVIVPMGDVALFSLMGVRNIMEMRGYPEWDSVLNAWILPTVHPNFIMRGNTNFGGVFIHDIQKACDIAKEGWEPAKTDYLLDPSPDKARAWCGEYLKLLESSRLGSPRRLAYDIETPIKGEDESEADADDESYQIDRIGFAYVPGKALSVPWNDDYLPIIRQLLGSSGEKVVWNAGFDNSRIASNGVAIRGLIHDGMVAWHVLNSDLPKKLGFVATFLVPDQQRWKHLSGVQPAYYNAVDADVELRAMARCEELLRATRMWDQVYDLQVLKLDPILSYMSVMGMPVDGEKRLTFAVELDERLTNVDVRVRDVVPQTARKLEKRKLLPKKLPDGALLLEVAGTRKVRVCSGCGEQAKKDHVTKKTLGVGRRDRQPNPCHGSSLVETVVSSGVPAILHPFNPSPKQILHYQKVVGHKPIMTGKAGVKRPTTDEKAIKQLMAKYPEDALYPLVLERRELDKVAGTYIGRVVREAA